MEIPLDLKPADGRFGSGPSKVPQRAVERLTAVAPTLLGTSHRKPAVKDVVRRIREGLVTYFGLPDGYEIALGNGGATLFWEIAGFSLIERRSAHAVCGEFSAKFAKAAEAMPWLDDPVTFEAPYGSAPTVAAVEGADTYALIHSETSTGVAMQLRRPSADGLVLVDATSAAGGIAFEASEVDAYYFSPQKSFASEGGLWLAALSPAAVERAEAIKATGRYIPTMLDLTVAVENSRLNQTYNTPALSTLFLMAEQVDELNERGGLAAVAKDCTEKAGVIYDWAEAREWATPFVAEPSARSTVVCTIDFDDRVSADDLAKTLRANGILDTEAYRKLGRNQLRIAVFPAVDRADVEALVGCIDYVVEHPGG